LSVVYSARTTDGARVAVKEIVINSGGTRDSKEAILRRILTEVELLRKLDHPNIVRCIDFFSDSGRFYIVLEACEGKNLRDYVLENGALSERAAIEIGIQCCAMLTYLHGMDPPIIHRDFTPDNMVRASSVRPDIPHDHHLEAHQHLGTPQHLETPRRDETTEGSLIRLIDFNVAEHANAGSSSQTIVGKHCFLAPEQWCGTFTVSGDVYQLGCTLYFLVTGQDPEPLKSCDPPDSLSPEFRAIIRKLTAREVADRYSHASEVAAALGALPSAKESAHA
jgi:serine/threonine protein kinase